MRNFNLLPEPGGVLDQDADLMDDINYFAFWYNLADAWYDQDAEKENRARSLLKESGLMK